jgi:hypothetical protein
VASAAQRRAVGVAASGELPELVVPTRRGRIDARSAFFTGEKSSARSVSMTSGRAAYGRASKTKSSNFTPFGLRLHRPAGRVDRRDLLVGPVKRQRDTLAPPARHPPDEVAVESTWIAMLPAR